MSDATTVEQAVAALALRRNVPFVRCAPDDVDVKAAQLLHRAEAQELEALPVAFGPDGKLLVAVADLDVPARLERVAALTNSRVYPALTTREALHTAIAQFAGDGPIGTVAAGAGDGHASAGRAPAAPLASRPEPVRVADDDRLVAHERRGNLDLDDVLMQLVNRRGSDLHLTAGLPPVLRLSGDLVPLEDHPVLMPDDIQHAIYGILRQRQREEFENTLELDTAYAISGVARFRLNVFRQREAMGAVMRLIPHEIQSMASLGIPPQVNNFAYLPRGFVLVTGPTGSGKSTTLASLIDVINRERAVHIMTVEDPVEFLHVHKRSVVNQRELGMDTHSFAAALKHILRQDPDVILVGEMRDLETIQMALTAAETGHLVFGTLHTQDAPQTIDRVIDVFPPHQQEQIRVMLSGALQGVVSQQLLKTIDGDGRVAAVEVMVATSAIRNLIREGKVHQMYSLLQAGKQHGMVTMDQSLADLVRRGVVAYEMALSRCSNVADFNRLCGRA